MPTTFVESGEQKLLARVLKQRASGSLMEEHNEVESQRRKLGDKMTLIHHAESIIGERVSDNPSVPTGPIWRNMVRSAIDGLGHDLGAIQPNGRWTIADGEVGIIEKKHRIVTGVDPDSGRELLEEQLVEYLLFAFEYIDARGENDLQYRNGRPVDPTQFNFDGLGPELASALRDMKSSKVEDQGAMLAQLVQQNKELMEPSSQSLHVNRGNGRMPRILKADLRAVVSSAINPVGTGERGTLGATPALLPISASLCSDLLRLIAELFSLLSIFPLLSSRCRILLCAQRLDCFFR